jgi:hypothetical protein
MKSENLKVKIEKLRWGLVCLFQQAANDLILDD